MGVQYGFQALNSGAITKAEFLDLNEKIGGRDVDGNLIAERSRGDVKGIENAFRHGRITSGDDDAARSSTRATIRDFNNDIHTRERTFAHVGAPQARQRHDLQPGDVDDADRRRPGANLAQMALLAHNEWLENIQADTSNRSYASKVIRNKPASLKDACWDATGAKFEERPTLDPNAKCNQLFPVHANPRIAAGGPFAGDVMKCQLKRVDRRDYAVSFTGEEFARLRSIFPGGVCDWSKKSVGWRDQKDTWLTYPRPGHSTTLNEDDRGHGHHD